MRTFAVIALLLFGGIVSVFATDTVRVVPVVADTVTVNEVYLSTVDAPGDRFRVESTLNRLLLVNITIPGQPPKQDTMKLTETFSGIVTVREVNARGGITRADVLIDSMFTLDPDIPVPMEVLEKGSRFEARVENGETVYLAGGVRLTETQSAELRLFVSLDAMLISQNDVFGSTAPQKVGNDWTVNPQKAAEYFKSTGDFKPSKIRGSTKLLSLKEEEGVRSMTTHSTLIASDIVTKVPPPAVPAGGSFLFSATIKKPVDKHTKGVFKEVAKMRITSNFRVANQDGSHTVGSQIIELTQQATVTPLKK